MISESFWSYDYVTGVDTSINALEISIAENKQFLTMVQKRTNIEHSTASHLAQLSQEPIMHAIPIHPNEYMPKSSTLQSALGVFTSETVNQAVMHTRIASDLESSVRIPLQKWCDMYAQRVHKCGSTLKDLVLRYQKLYQNVNKQRAAYYSQCHKYEDQTSAGGSPSDPIIKTIRLLKEHLRPDMPPPSPKSSQRQDTIHHHSVSASTRTSRSHSTCEIDKGDANVINNASGMNTVTANKALTEEGNKLKSSSPRYRIAGLDYTAQDLADVLNVILQDVTLSEYKVPLWGSYSNVTSGSMLATATRKHLKNDSFAYAEKFGQSLIDHGFLKPVGQISNRFQSTHTSHYQFQQLTFDLIAEESSSEDSDGDSTSSSAEQSSEEHSISGHSIGSHTSSAISTQRSTGNIGATDASEEHYLQAVVELDVYRCDMELEIMQIYKFSDKLEQDREEAIKRAMNDFIQISFRPDEQNQMLSRLRGAQLKINPNTDLEEFSRKNQTGPFIPTVTIFHGYASGSYIQTFGVDLPHSSFFVDLVIDWLSTLPEKDTKRLSSWTRPEPISEIYKLRAQINTGKPFSADSIFRFFPLSVVVSTFRQYLSELPESVVSFMIYERIKQLYSPRRASDQPMESTPSRRASTQMSASPSSSSPPRTPNNNISASRNMATPRDMKSIGSPGPSAGTTMSPSSTIYNTIPESAVTLVSTSPVSPGEMAMVLIQIPHINRSVSKRIITYSRETFPEETFEQLASSLALPLVRPRASSTVTMNDTHTAKFLHALLIQAPEVFHSLELKQKESDTARQEKIGLNSFSASPSASPLGVSRGQQIPKSSSARDFSSSFLGPSAASPSNSADSSLVNGGSSGNVGMRPLNMAHHGRYASLGKLNKPISSKGSGSAGEVSPARGPGFNPIVPLSSPLNHGQTSQGLSINLTSTASASRSPIRPVNPRMPSSTSSSDLQLPKLRMKKSD